MRTEKKGNKTIFICKLHRGTVESPKEFTHTRRHTPLGLISKATGSNNVTQCNRRTGLA